MCIFKVGPLITNQPLSFEQQPKSVIWTPSQPQYLKRYTPTPCLAHQSISSAHLHSFTGPAPPTDIIEVETYGRCVANHFPRSNTALKCHPGNWKSNKICCEDYSRYCIQNLVFYTVCIILLLCVVFRVMLNRCRKVSHEPRVSCEAAQWLIDSIHGCVLPERHESAQEIDGRGKFLSSVLMCNSL